MITYIKARRLAKDYINIALALQAMTEIQPIMKPDCLYQNWSKLHQEIFKTLKDHVNKVRSAGPKVAARWRRLAKKYLNASKNTDMITYFMRVARQLLSLRLSRRDFPRDFLEKRVDGCMIRAMELTIDKLDLCDRR